MRELLDHFAEPLFSGVLLPRVGVRADAEDLLRETMVRAVESMGRFEWREGGLWPWLRRIATNLVRDRGRRLAARRRLESGYEAELRTLAPGLGAGAEAALIEEEERRICMERLRRAMEALNERYRRAIELRLLEERSRAEAAEALGVTVGTFDVLLHRALKALRRAWPEVA